MTYAYNPQIHGENSKSLFFNPLTKIRSELLYTVFHKIFDVVPADTPALKEQMYRLRYQVFCKENQNYEDPADHPDGLERDEYDAHAEHTLLIYKPTGLPIGTTRIIKPKDKEWYNSFPLQNLCTSKYLHLEQYVKNSCEFSRLCVSSKYRRLIKQDLSFRQQMFGYHEKPLINIALAVAPLGLIRGAFELAIRNNTLNVFGIMVPRYIARLEQSGMVYEKIGPEIDFHGMRRPFLCNILETFDNGAANHREVWNILSSRGKNHQDAMRVYDNSFKTII